MISLVIPVYNEAAVIASTVATAQQVLTRLGKPFEIVVVDDGSTDGTNVALRGIADITLVVHPHNVGYGRALKTGIAAAKYDTIAIADADGTYPLDELPTLIEAYDGSSYDMVVGARSGENYRRSPFKAPLRTALKWLVEYTAGRKIPDVNSGLRVFSRKTAMGYFKHLCDTFSFTTSLTLSYMMTGRFVAYRPIRYDQRIGQTKVRLLHDSLRTLQYILQAVVYYNPLKIFLLLSAICIMFAAACFIEGAVLSMRVGYFLGIGSILMGMLIASIGFLAVLLKQIMDR